MDYILDTHIALWCLYDDSKLSAETFEIINNPNHNIYFSAVSVMEIAIKHRKYPDSFNKDAQTFYQNSLDSDFYAMPLKPKHAICMDTLKLKEGYTHNNPFDRALIAQAKKEGFKLLTHDEMLKHYDEECIMFV